MSPIFTTSTTTTTFHPYPKTLKPILSPPSRIPILPFPSIKFSTLYPSYPLTTSATPEPKIAFNYDFAEEPSSSPWEGAVVYKRDPRVTHVEYCTTLERLGLGKFSTEVSRKRASVMGLRVVRSVKEWKDGTPVMVSVGVGRRVKGKLRLDGIVKTVLSLACNRCGEPAAECVFSNFTLLLTEKAIEEGDVINMGVLFGEGKQNAPVSIGDDEDDDNTSIDLDDRLYFPAEVNEIDISKNIRDMIHIEITINAVCDSNCKGLCLVCGANLNTSRCRCRKQEEEKNCGPLGNLKTEMQKK